MSGSWGQSPGLVWVVVQAWCVPLFYRIRWTQSPYFRAIAVNRDKKRNYSKEDMINTGHGSFGNISVGNVNIKRPLLFESCCKIKKTIFSCGKMEDTVRETKSILFQNAIVSNSENNWTYLMTFKQRLKTHNGAKVSVWMCVCGGGRQPWKKISIFSKHSLENGQKLHWKAQNDATWEKLLLDNRRKLQHKILTFTTEQRK